MNLGYKGNSGQEGVRFWPIYICFIIFGILLPFSKAEFQITTLLLSLLISLVIGVLTVRLLIILLNVGNPILRQKTGGMFAREAVGTGMLFMIPFTALAVMAQVGLGWDAVMPFASAAIMTAAASVGTEAMKKGAQGIKNVMIPSFLAFLLSTGWMMLIGLLP